MVFMGDAGNLSCRQELDRFFAVMADLRALPLLMVASNHDGFYSGNFTQKADADGKLRYTDMPEDWRRACATPPTKADFILTKARAVREIAAGRMLASVDFDMFKIGCTAARAAVRCLAGEPLPDRIILPTEVIDASNYQAWLTPVEQRTCPEWADVVRS